MLIFKLAIFDRTRNTRTVYIFLYISCASFKRDLLLSCRYSTCLANYANSTSNIYYRACVFPMFTPHVIRSTKQHKYNEEIISFVCWNPQARHAFLSRLFVLLGDRDCNNNWSATKNNRSRNRARQSRKTARPRERKCAEFRVLSAEQNSDPTQ